MGGFGRGTCTHQIDDTAFLIHILVFLHGTFIADRSISLHVNVSVRSFFKSIFCKTMYFEHTFVTFEVSKTLRS